MSHHSATDNLVAVVSDFDLGDGENGIEVLRQVRSQYPEAARVLVTGKPQVTTITQARLNGTIHALMAKPWNSGDLCNIVESLINQ